MNPKILKMVQNSYRYYVDLARLAGKQDRSWNVTRNPLSSASQLRYESLSPIYELFLPYVVQIQKIDLI